MDVSEYDVIRLKDGREGTVVYIFSSPLAYLVELEEKDGDIETVKPGQIEKVIAKAS